MARVRGNNRANGPPASAKRNPMASSASCAAFVFAGATHTKARASIAPVDFLARSRRHQSRGDRDHEMDISNSGARFGGCFFEFAGIICVSLQTPLSQLLLFDEHDAGAGILVRISVQIFVFTGRRNARPRRGVERRPGGRRCLRRPLALAAFREIAITSAVAQPVHRSSNERR
jgi:hypothetical protein